MWVSQDRSGDLMPIAWQSLFILANYGKNYV